MNLKKILEVFTSKCVGTGPSSYEKRIYRTAVSRSLRNTGLEYSKSLVIMQGLLFAQSKFMFGPLMVIRGNSY